MMLLMFVCAGCLFDAGIAAVLDYPKHAMIAGIIGVLCLLGMIGGCVAETESHKDVVRTTIEYTYIDGSKERMSYVTLEGDNIPTLYNRRGSCMIDIPYHGLILNVIKYRICDVDTIERGIRVGDFDNKYIFAKGGSK